MNKRYDFSLRDIFPMFCISARVISELFCGKFKEKVMSVSLAMIFISLINPIPVMVFAAVYNDHFRLYFTFSLAIIVIFSIFAMDNSVFIPFLVYIGAVKMFIFQEALADAIMGLVFTFIFFAVYYVHKIRESDMSVEFQDEDEFIKVTSEDIKKAGAPKTLEGRFASVEDIRKNSQKADDDVWRKPLEPIHLSKNAERRLAVLRLFYRGIREFMEEYGLVSKIVDAVCAVYLLSLGGFLFFFGALVFIISKLLGEYFYVTATSFLGIMFSVYEIIFSHYDITESYIKLCGFSVMFLSVPILYFKLRATGDAESEDGDGGIPSGGKVPDGDLSQSPTPSSLGERFDYYRIEGYDFEEYELIEEPVTDDDLKERFYNFRQEDVIVRDEPVADFKAAKQADLNLDKPVTAENFEERFYSFRYGDDVKYEEPVCDFKTVEQSELNLDEPVAPPNPASRFDNYRYGDFEKKSLEKSITNMKIRRTPKPSDQYTPPENPDHDLSKRFDGYRYGDYDIMDIEVVKENLKKAKKQNLKIKSKKNRGKNRNTNGD